MGVDFTALSNAVRTQNEDDGLFGYVYDDASIATVNDGMESGYYVYTRETAIDGPRMPYSMYFRFRKWIANLGGSSAEKMWNGNDSSMPFYEMVNYSDCDGFFGPDTCSKLANDFESHLEKARQSDTEPRFLGFYESFLACFKHAAGSGMVILG